MVAADTQAEMKTPVGSTDNPNKKEMKKTILTTAKLFAAMLILVLVGTHCMQDEFEGKVLSFTGEIAGLEYATKTSLDANDKVHWSENDTIIINGVEYEATPNQENSKKASFIKVGDAQDPEGSSYTAYYPACIYNGGVPTLPATQTYAEGKISNIPMYSHIENSTSLKFNNICGVVELTLKGTALVRKIEVSDPDEALCGAFVVTEGAAIVSETPSESSKKITLDCGDGVTLNKESGVKFWIAIPANVHTLTFRVIGGDADNQYYEKKTKNDITVNAAKIYAFEWTGLDAFAKHSNASTSDGITGGSVSVDKSANVAEGDTVTITATPLDDTYEVDKITVTKTGTEETVEVDAENKFTMPGCAVTVSATFKKKTHAVTINEATCGTFTVTPADSSAIESGASVEVGKSVTLASTPETGYVLDKWTVTKTGDTETVVTVTDNAFTMPNYPVTVSASFKIGTYALTKGSCTNGSVAITDGESNAITEADFNTTVHIAATPNTGYKFTSWNVTDGVSLADAAAASTSFSMPGKAVTVGATFEGLPYDVTVVSNDHGSIKVGSAAANTNTTAKCGDAVTLTSTPGTGYDFTSWSVYKTGEPATTVSVSNNKFTMPAYAVTVEATFTLHDYTLTKSSATGGSFTVKIGDSEVTKGHYQDEVTLEATPAAGYAFNNWMISGASVGSSTSSTTTFTIGTSNVTITATFIQIAGSASVSSASGRTSCNWVQLWAGGPRWAEFNVGATIDSYANVTSTTDGEKYTTANVGGLYAWGTPGTDARTSTWANSVETGTEDIAASVWGDKWTTPTTDELNALMNTDNCTLEWCDGEATKYSDNCTLAGLKVSGKAGTAYASNSIFLPAAGAYYSDKTEFSKVGEHIILWSSSKSTSEAQAKFLLYNGSEAKSGDEARKVGLGIRPVLCTNITPGLSNDDGEYGF